MNLFQGLLFMARATEIVKLSDKLKTKARASLYKQGVAGEDNH